MNKINKVIGFIVILAVIIKPASIIYAQEFGTRSSQYISAYSGAVEKSNSGIDIKYTMMARCDKLNVSIELQTYTNGEWATIKTWSVDSATSPFSGKVTYTEKVSNEYRAVIAYKAYVSGVMVELKALTVYP